VAPDGLPPFRRSRSPEAPIQACGHDCFGTIPEIQAVVGACGRDAPAAVPQGQSRQRTAATAAGSGRSRSTEAVAQTPATTIRLWAGNNGSISPEGKSAQKGRRLARDGVTGHRS
jgi:hypothetical protein